MSETQIIDKTMSFRAANLWGSALAIAVFVLFLIPQWLIWGQTLNQFLNRFEMTWFIVILFFAALIISISTHELLHGIGYNLGGANWSQIKFGVHGITPYAHCTVPLDVSDYRLAVALPGLMLGLMPAVYGLLIGSFPILIYGVFMTSAASGDALILWLLRDAPPEAKVLDHPSKIGCELHF